MLKKMVKKTLRKISGAIKYYEYLLNIPVCKGADEEYFGHFLSTLKNLPCELSSEFGLGLVLFSLVVNTRAQNVIEIGRFRGFSTFAIASGLRFLDSGFKVPQAYCQRKWEIDYKDLHLPKKRMLYSIDPVPMEEVYELIDGNRLSKYVTYIDEKSNEAKINVLADVLFIDGEHSYEACLQDFEKYVLSYLKEGGYFILHDYYGWFGKNGENNSPVKKICDYIIKTRRYENILVDTYYMSFVVFRKHTVS